MRRVAKWLGWIVALLIGVPILVVIFVLVAANTGPGRHAIETLVPRVTGHTVRITGFAGRFPDVIRIARVELLDPQGVYATVEDFVFEWSPLQLLHWHIDVDRIAASYIDVKRMPGGNSSGSTGVPAPTAVRQLQVARLDLGPSIAGTPASIALQGSGEANSETDFHVALQIDQRDGPGRYTLNATSSANDLQASLRANEAAHGLISEVAGLPELGAIAIDASLQGPRAGAATHVALSAGPLRADIGGTVDLVRDGANLTVSATAPAMQPRPDISWQSVSLDAHVRGPFARLDAEGRMQVNAISAAGASASNVTADITGNAGQLHLDGEVVGLRVPAPNPDLLSAAPLVIKADARLDQPERPVHVTLQHPLFSIDANADVGTTRRVDATVKLADMAPVAAMDHLSLQGAVTLGLHAVQQGDTTTLDATGTVGVTGGLEQARTLVGDNGGLRLAATLRGKDVTLSRFEFTGRAMSLSASGSVADNQVALNWSLGVSDLTAAEPSLAGQFMATGRVSGTTDNLAMISDINGGVSARGMSSGELKAHIAIDGLPNAPSGQITAQGTLLDAPVNVAVAMRRDSNGLSIEIQQAKWKSLEAGGAVELPTSTMVPAGKVHLAMTRLADVAPLVGRAIAGSVKVSLDATADKLHATAQIEGAELAGVAGASRVSLVADVDQPQSHPTLAARLDAEGIKASGVAGSLHATATGPANAIDVKVAAALPDLHGAPGRLNAAATVDTGARSVSVAKLDADWHQQSVRLLAPVKVSFAQGVAVDRLRLGIRQAVLEVSGRAGSTLDLTASLRNLPADIAAAVSPSLALSGSVEAEARITGTTARPVGTIRLAASGLRASSGPGRALPAANISANAKLNGTEAQIDGRIAAGSSRVTLTGRAPLAASGALDLRSNGTIDLALLDPYLTANGQRVSGQLRLDATIGGSVAAPAISGSAALSGGDVQDYASGVHLSNVALRVQGDGRTLRITQLSAKAGDGTIDGSGSIGVLAPQVPVDITLTARNAKPLASDMISAVIDANLTLRGEALGQLTVAGDVHVRQADIQIPERLPTSIAVLPVRQPGAKPEPAQSAATAPEITLNLALSAPGRIFVRGRGIDAEFGGNLRLAGTLAAPRTVGAFVLRRGSMNLAGTTLTFTEGQISFNGGSVTDPALHLVATSSTSSVTATLTLGGTVHDPKVTLTSVPQLPQDEILAQLLFGTGTGSLGPLQIAEIASSLATLTGVGGGIGDPLNSVRQGLGLDRLSIGSSANGSPTLQAGRYIAPGVYVGAQQSASGGGSQATVQVDITKGLKLQGTAGTGSQSAVGAAGTSNGSSVGLSYQFQY